MLHIRKVGVGPVISDGLVLAMCFVGQAVDPCHEGGGSEHSYFDEVESRRNSSTSSRSKVPKVNTSSSSRSDSNSSSR